MSRRGSTDTTPTNATEKNVATSEVHGENNTISLQTIPPAESPDEVKLGDDVSVPAAATRNTLPSNSVSPSPPSLFVSSRTGRLEDTTPASAPVLPSPPPSSSPSTFQVAISNGSDSELTTTRITPLTTVNLNPAPGAAYSSSSYSTSSLFQPAESTGDSVTGSATMRNSVPEAEAAQEREESLTFAVPVNLYVPPHP